jgi:integrase
MKIKMEVVKYPISSIDKLQGFFNQSTTPREKAAQQYVIDAFRRKMPSLILFAFENESILKLASHLLKYTTGSKATLYQYVFGVHRFSCWLGKKPDIMLREVLLHKKFHDEYIQKISDFIGDLQAQGLAPGTIANHVKGVKALYNANGIPLVFPYRLSRRVKYPDRSPTPEELTRILNLADIRDKTIISMMALGGFRVGTLSQLKYRHVKNDLETGIVPLHIHVEAEITKGKYCEYDTFIGSESVNYLRAYLELRRKPKKSHIRRDRDYLGEIITNESPLIRDKHCLREVKSITPASIHTIIHRLYLKAGLIKMGKIRYELRAHSLRKYFRTQLTALGTIPVEYIEYMMGHMISIYNDVKMKGVEFLRNLYTHSGLSIKQKTKTSKIEQLKTIIEAWGMNPNEILSREALSKPHRTIIVSEKTQVEILNQALKQAIIKELAN